MALGVSHSVQMFLPKNMKKSPFRLLYYISLQQMNYASAGLETWQEIEERDLITQQLHLKADFTIKWLLQRM